MIKIAKLILSFSAIISLFGCTHNDEQKNQSSNNKNDTHIASSKSIYTLTDFKSKKKLITVEDGNATWPIYSPDGNRIAFTGKVNGVLATYTMDSETGQNLKMITSPKGGLHEGVLDWQSDGSLICVTKNLDGTFRLSGLFFKKFVDWSFERIELEKLAINAN